MNVESIESCSVDLETAFISEEFGMESFVAVADAKE